MSSNQNGIAVKLCGKKNPFRLWLNQLNLSKNFIINIGSKPHTKFNLYSHWNDLLGKIYGFCGFFGSFIEKKIYDKDQMY